MAPDKKSLTCNFLCYCVVSDPARVSRTSNLGPDEIVVGRSTSRLFVDEDTSVTLSCPVSGIDDPMTQWSRIVTNDNGIAMEMVITTNANFSVRYCMKSLTVVILECLLLMV